MRKLKDEVSDFFNSLDKEIKKLMSEMILDEDGKDDFNFEVIKENQRACFWRRKLDRKKN